jgi:N-acetylmuramoyl-L-alanine amidase
MKIIRHKLYNEDGSALPFRKSPCTGGKLDPRYLVIHYTAGGNAESSVNWLTNLRSNASAHVVIGRDGSVTQLVPFDTIARHAGVSSWYGLNGLNKYSIGIELDNAGKLWRHGNKWRAWFGTEYEEDDVIVATHKNGSESTGWQLFTPVQLEAALETSLTIMRHYDLQNIVGHDDISPGRKVDPGPAFPMESFRGRLLGRADEEEIRFKTITALNIRTGPGTQHSTMDVSPLPEGTKVEVLREKGSWRLIDVIGKVKGQNDIQGWVHGRYLIETDHRPDATGKRIYSPV